MFVFNIAIPPSLVEASYKQMAFMRSGNMYIFFLAILHYGVGEGAYNLLPTYHLICLFFSHYSIIIDRIMRRAGMKSGLKNRQEFHSYVK